MGTFRWASSGDLGDMACSRLQSGDWVVMIGDVGPVSHPVLWTHIEMPNSMTGLLNRLSKVNLVWPRDRFNERDGS